MAREWRPVYGYEGLYKISDEGKVYSFKNKKILSTFFHRGYEMVTVSKNNKAKQYGAHVLVLLSFKGPHPTLKMVDHIDGVRNNNHPDNLRWTNHQGNYDNSVRLGRNCKGEKHGQSILKNEQVLDIMKNVKLNDRGRYVGLKDYATKYGVSATTVARIARGIGWRHLAIK